MLFYYKYIVLQVGTPEFYDWFTLSKQDHCGNICRSYVFKAVRIASSATAESEWVRANGLLLGFLYGNWYMIMARHNHYRHGLHNHY